MGDDTVCDRPDFADIGRAGRTHWRHYLAGAVVVVAFWLVLSSIAAAIAIKAGDTLAFRPIISGKYDLTGLYGYLSVGPILFVSTAANVAVILGIFAAVTWVHRRSWRSVLTARDRFSWRIFLHSLLVATLIIAAYSTVYAIAEDRLDEYGARLRVWVPGTLVFAAATCLAVLTAEIAFRGYLLQAVGRFSSSLHVRVLLAAAVAFAFFFHKEGMYIFNLSLESLKPALIWPFLGPALIALYLTWLAIRGNGLESCLGLHIALEIAPDRFAIGKIGEYSVRSAFENTGGFGPLQLAILVSLFALHFLYMRRVWKRHDREGDESA